jgi:hypothetical protein
MLYNNQKKKINVLRRKKNLEINSRPYTGCSANWITTSTYRSTVDIEKAFERFSDAFISQSHGALGVQELLVQALQNYVLIHWLCQSRNQREERDTHNDPN